MTNYPLSKENIVAIVLVSTLLFGSCSTLEESKYPGNSASLKSRHFVDDIVKARLEHLNSTFKGMGYLKASYSSVALEVSNAYPVILGELEANFPDFRLNKSSKGVLFDSLHRDVLTGTIVIDGIFFKYFWPSDKSGQKFRRSRLEIKQITSLKNSNLIGRDTYSDVWDSWDNQRSIEQEPDKYAHASFSAATRFVMSNARIVSSESRMFFLYKG